MAQALPVSDLINVTVTLTPQAAQQQNVNSLLLLGPTDVIDVTERMRTYSTITGVATDFLTTTPEYKAAALWFGQNPQPTQLYIGRWAQGATHGTLIGGGVAIANQLMSAWSAVTTGAFGVTINGSAIPVSGLNFSTDTNLNGVASRIQAALLAATPAAPVGTTFIWNSNYQRFELKSGTTGTGSTVTFLSAPGSGTDISAMLAMISTSSGAYVVGGIAAETALSAVEAMDVSFGSKWYSVEVLGAADQDALDVAAYIEAENPHKFQWATTQESGVISSVDTSSLPYVLKQAKYNKTAAQYSTQNAYAAVSMAARILTTQWDRQGSTITLMYKQEPGIVAETLNENQMQALLAKNCNVFVNYANDTAIIQPGICASGQFIDTVIGADWFAGRIQANVYNLLYTTPTKIPQTDAGMNMIANTIEAACADAVNNGLLAPGVWNSNGIGQIEPGDTLSKGYYVYYPPVATQNQSLRAQRISVPFTVLAKLAGAVHTVDVAVLVNP